MNINNKTILITGGGSGIGYETAKLLSEQGNKVIIIGRTKEKLESAAATLTNTIPIACDINNEHQVKALLSTVSQHYPELSILINNAGKAFAYTHSETADAYAKAKEEMETNYFSIIRLTEQLLPILKKQPEAAIVNVSSIVAFAPSAILPTYSDSKAALHSYTQALRYTLSSETNIKVFELMPPMVNTSFAKEIGGEQHGMPAGDVASALIEGLEQNTYEIYVGKTAAFRDFFFAAPLEAVNMINQR